MPLNDALSGVALLPSDKENSFFIQGVKPGVISIGTICDDDTLCWQAQCATYGDVMSLAVSDSDEAGQQTVVVKTDVNFDGTFRLTEIGPRED